ncbi:uncharacterized protein LOC129600654 [Paramacrobiotus metropolitanus]|uniref:uncharacterized protein LOC129600654 n=1 Tax=Paramacrobiotus metropolitanus TaxID=2943436 RepID=UPI00244609D0|nr:uncharacterized protein LOC129600654 [Paramacrobiotus metropolitanus]
MAVLWTSAVLFLGIQTVVGQCPAGTKVPIVVAGQPLVDLERAVGLWHEYYHLDGGTAADASAYNLVMNSTVLGAYPQPGPTKSYFTSWNYNGYWPQDFPATTNLKCSIISQYGNLTSDGKRKVIANFGQDPNELLSYTYTNLFTDYKLFQVLYRCNTPNADGKNCDDVMAWVHTKVPPPQLTTTQKSYIEKASDWYLAQICKKFSDLIPSRWDMSLPVGLNPACNMALGTGPALPAKLAAAIPIKGF